MTRRFLVLEVVRLVIRVSDVLARMLAYMMRHDQFLVLENIQLVADIADFNCVARKAKGHRIPNTIYFAAATLLSQRR